MTKRTGRAGDFQLDIFFAGNPGARSFRKCAWLEPFTPSGSAQAGKPGVQVEITYLAIHSSEEA